MTGICSSLQMSDDATGQRWVVLTQSTGQTATEAQTCSVITLHLHGGNGRQVRGNEQFPSRLNGSLLFGMSFLGFARMCFAIGREQNVRIQGHGSLTPLSLTFFQGVTHIAPIFDVSPVSPGQTGTNKHNEAWLVRRLCE